MPLGALSLESGGETAVALKLVASQPQAEAYYGVFAWWTPPEPLSSDILTGLYEAPQIDSKVRNDERTLRRMPWAVPPASGMQQWKRRRPPLAVDQYSKGSTPEVVHVDLTENQFPSWGFLYEEARLSGGRLSIQEGYRPFSPSYSSTKVTQLLSVPITAPVVAPLRCFGGVFGSESSLPREVFVLLNRKALTGNHALVGRPSGRHRLNTWSEVRVSSEEPNSNADTPLTGSRQYRWAIPRFLLPIHGGVLHAAITERISRAAEDAAREGRRRNRRRATAGSNEVVGPMTDATCRRQDIELICRVIFALTLSVNDGQGSEDGSPPPPGSPVPSDPPGVEENFPEMHLALLPNIEVAAFRQRRGVDEARMAEHRVPSTEETLFCYSDSVEAWERVSEVSYILVLPRNRYLRLLLVAILEAPVASVIVFSGLSGILFKALVTFIPEQIVYDFVLLPAMTLAKFLACCLLYALRVVLLGVWKFAGYTFAVAGRSTRICLVSVLNVVIKYLDRLRGGCLNHIEFAIVLI
ncbi:hypothetical protein NMY22_g2981 [Coprinellus aureogranulatus]|nr:hypothetical protein NMY22_g2981 [Coprinellus aureogranulatus]